MDLYEYPVVSSHVFSYPLFGLPVKIQENGIRDQVTPLYVLKFCGTIRRIMTFRISSFHLQEYFFIFSLSHTFFLYFMPLQNTLPHHIPFCMPYSMNIYIYSNFLIKFKMEKKYCVCDKPAF